MDILNLIFNGANLFVLPFWALMTLVPRWEVSRRVMSSYIPFVALALTYLYCFINSLDPGTAEAFSDPNLGLADLAALFANEKVTAAGWVHFLVMDLFVGRWIYLRGLDLNVFTRHSLVLCLFAGPLGLLSHMVTETISQRFFQREGQESASPQEEAA
ncbi:MAG: ABA4-like family protein [Cyanobacteria bacterium P01_H01_bin.119]